MEVSFAIYDGDSFENYETWADARLEAEDSDELWLVLDDNPVIALPRCYNRLTLWPGMDGIRTAVLDRREIEGAWGENNPGPLGPNAPLLTIDKESCTATWTSASGQVRTLYGHVAD